MTPFILLCFLALSLILPGHATPSGIPVLNAANECINARCRSGYGWPGHPFLADPWGPMVLPESTSSSATAGPGVPLPAGSGTQSTTTDSSLAVVSPATPTLPPSDFSVPTQSLSNTSNASTNASPSTSLTISSPSPSPPHVSSAVSPHLASSSSRPSSASASRAPSPPPSSAPSNVSGPNATVVSTSGPTSQSDIQAFLAGHNSVRAQHGAAPLSYSQDLAAKAQQWADGCVFRHSGGTLGPFGENLAAGTGAGFGIAQALRAWTDEACMYYAKFISDFHVVWKATTQVGCARQDCDGIFPSSFGKAHFYVCEYFPQGNVIGAFGVNVQA